MLTDHPLLFVIAALIVGYGVGKARGFNLGLTYANVLFVLGSEQDEQPEQETGCTDPTCTQPSHIEAPV